MTPVLHQHYSVDVHGSCSFANNSNSFDFSNIFIRPGHQMPQRMSDQLEASSWSWSSQQLEEEQVDVFWGPSNKRQLEELEDVSLGPSTRRKVHNTNGFPPGHSGEGHPGEGHGGEGHPGGEGHGGGNGHGQGHGNGHGHGPSLPPGLVNNPNLNKGQGSGGQCPCHVVQHPAGAGPEDDHQGAGNPSFASNISHLLANEKKNLPYP